MLTGILLFNYFKQAGDNIKLLGINIKHNLHTKRQTMAYNMLRVYWMQGFRYVIYVR